MNTETDWQARAEKAELELTRVQAQLPATYYAAAPLDDRVRNMVEHWRKLVPLAEELERVEAQAAAMARVLSQCCVAIRIDHATNAQPRWKALASECQDMLAKLPVELAATPRLIPAEKLAPLIRGLKAADASLHAQESDSCYHVAVAEVDKGLAAARALMEDAQ